MMIEKKVRKKSLLSNERFYNDNECNVPSSSSWFNI